MKKILIGKEGENKAHVYLESLGHTMLRRNFRKRNGEIDIITRFENTLYFIEVKTWRSALSHPLESLTNKKCDRMRSMAKLFLYECGWDESNFSISFSLLYVQEEKIDFYTNLF